MAKQFLSRRMVGAGIAVFVTASLAGLIAVQRGGGVSIDSDDIGGVVRGPNGPEAGVWVIAETTDLPTKFNRIVVTGDDGQYLLPDLPDATYDVWVRGYGLVDSPKTQISPGTTQNLTAVVAPDERAAAHYYPAAYWFSLIEVPGKDQFPGSGPEGNGISPSVESPGGMDQPHQITWLHAVSSTGEPGHARDTAGARRVRLARGCVGATDRVRASGSLDDRWHQRTRPSGGAGDVCKLDRPDP